MKTFYSILSINIRPEISERLSVGLIMILGEKVFFRYSISKLNIIQKLTGKEIWKATHNYLKLVQSSVSNKALSTNNDLLDLKVENKYCRLFSEQYIEYLSRYNNNFVSFSKPNFIELEATDQIFDVLYTKFVGNYDEKKGIEPVKQIESFKKQFYPKLKAYFNIEQEINSIQFSGLLTPVKVDLMGKNDIEVFAQSIDFEKKGYSIEYNIGNLLQIKRALPNAKQFVVGFEPDKHLEINHRIWNNVRHTTEFEYVDVSEAEKITEYAISHGVTPLFD